MKEESSQEGLSARLYAEGTLFALERWMQTKSQGRVSSKKPARWRVAIEYGDEKGTRRIERDYFMEEADRRKAVSMRLRFFHAGKAVAFFERGYGCFLPCGHWWRVASWMQLFQALHGLGKAMKSGPPRGLAEGDRTRCRVGLLMTFIGRGLEVLVREDSVARKVARATPAGEVWFEGPDGSILLGVRIDGRGFLSLRSRSEEGKDVRRARLRFRDWEVADAILRGTTDPQLEVNRGSLMVFGYVPLADRIGLLLDRLNRFVKAA